MELPNPIFHSYQNDHSKKQTWSKCHLMAPCDLKEKSSLLANMQGSSQSCSGLFLQHNYPSLTEHIY